MGKVTKIAYCDSTVNPVMGCTGCELYSHEPKLNHCYAAALCRRYAGRKGWPKDFEQPEFFPGRIEQALRWPNLTGTDRPDKPWLNGYPRIIFVNDLGDGFCPSALDWFMHATYRAMMDSPHVWLFLTKWPERIGQFFPYPPAPNMWLGTTVTRPSNVDRLYKLLQIPAKVHWLSIEPMLGPLDISHELHGAPQEMHGGEQSVWEQTKPPPSWVIVGCESGPNRRQMPPVWGQSLFKQCKQANVPVFIKQLSIAHSPKRSSRNGQVSHDPAEWPEDLRVREMPNVP